MQEQVRCTECNTRNIKAVNIIAEHNAGELFDVNICRDCLLRYAAMIDSPKEYMNIASGALQDNPKPLEDFIASLPQEEHQAIHEEAERFIAEE